MVASQEAVMGAVLHQQNTAQPVQVRIFFEGVERFRNLKSETCRKKGVEFTPLAKLRRFDLALTFMVGV